MKSAQVLRSTEWTPERIRNLRLGLRLTQERFAQAIGVTFSTVNRWEHGRSIPTLMTERIFIQFERKLRREIEKTTHP